METYVDDSGFDEGGSVYLCIDQLRFRVPDANDNYPMEWWHIEAITNVPASQVAKSWRGQKNKKLDYVRSVLNPELVPYPNGSFTSVDDFRRTIVGNRYNRKYNESSEPILPALFTERNDVLLTHAIKLLEDVWGQHRDSWGYLFAMAGATRYIPVLLWIDRDRRVIWKLDNEEQMGWLLRKTIRFSKPGRRPKANVVTDATNVIDMADYAAVRTLNVKPSRELIRDASVEPCTWPVLDAIIRIPSLRADGSVLSQVGYDAETRIWYEPDAVFKDVKIPDDPTIEEVMWAREALAFPFREFPLTYGYASVIAVILERVCMPMLNGPRPLHIIDAPLAGSGKSLIAKILTTCMTGNEGGGVSWPKTNTEMEKILGSLLLGTRVVTTFDNIVDDEIGPPALANMITGTQFVTRKLGVSETPMLPNFVTWMATLNRARVNEDFQRRSVLTTIDVSLWGIVDPTKRTFQDEEVIETCKANRPIMIQAALILARNWVMRGKQRDPGLIGVLGGFEKWLHVVGGILWTAGVTGLSESIRAVAARDVSKQEGEMFLEIWGEHFGFTPVTTLQLATLAITQGLYLKTMANQKGQWIGRRFKEEILDQMEKDGRCRRVGDYRPCMWTLPAPKPQS
jgi:hypothetical protein